MTQEQTYQSKRASGASLNNFRTAESRAAGDCAPAVWYQQMTGDDWGRDGQSFDVAKKRYRRLLDEHKAAEREREKKRDRSQRQRSADDGGAAAQRKCKRRAEQVAAAAKKYPVVQCSFTIGPDLGGRVQLQVRPSKATSLPARSRGRPSCELRGAAYQLKAELQEPKEFTWLQCGNGQQIPG